MIAALRISSMLALVLACVLLAIAGICWLNDGPGSARTEDIPCVADRLANAGAGAAASSLATSPLVAQAQKLAEFLSPPQRPEPMPAAAGIASGGPPPAPKDPPVKLTLHATSCCPDQPGKSMALVSRSGGAQQDQRWVKEGAQFGSFVIHEVRRGGVTYRDGDVLYEATVERNESPRSIVHDLRGGSQRVSATHDVPVPAVPQDVEISDN